MLNLSESPTAKASTAPVAVPNGGPGTGKTNKNLASRPLLPRQRLFVQLIRDGHTHAAAYRVAYCQPDIKPQAAARLAYAVATNPRVATALERMNHDGLWPNLLSKEEILRVMAGIIMSPQATRAERIRAGEAYTTIAGYKYQPPADEQPPSLTDAHGMETPPSFRITLDIFRNAPSRVKSVAPLTVNRPAAAAAGNGNGNGAH